MGGIWAQFEGWVRWAHFFIYLITFFFQSDFGSKFSEIIDLLMSGCKDYQDWLMLQEMFDTLP